ncbi:unnamed protein product [Rhizophagus irregularis]|uniref:BAR-domain-containing protein n=1 Tax=Rhizophagus irregularis TaxID=588596 RepID=A0A2I1GMD2_9GLOM|nr:BAR-domain-containing protein [Rhizophagus irregularis]CAB4434312.1 unnamed protein product [Rhizophagus irregularis]
MSWTSFKKSVNRTGTKISQKIGAIEKTVDQDFDLEEQRIKSLEAKCEKLHKETKGYLESMRTLSSAQLRIAETVNHFYEDSSDNSLVGNKYKEVIDRLDHDCRTYLDEPYRRTVNEPIGRLCDYFPDINEAIKRRNNKLLDYDKQRAKARKLIEKPPDDTTKLPRAEQAANEAREMYESLNNQLCTELPKLIDLRVPYIDPTFEALVKIQLKFSQESYDSLNSLKNHFPPNSEGPVDNNVDAVLQQMRDLAICGMS